MGCVSSNLLNQDDDFSQLGGAAFGHHIVSLTSSTYGLLTLDPPPQQSPTTPPVHQPRFTLASTPEAKSLWSEPRPLPPRPEVINSWELMSGLDADSFRFSPSLNKEDQKSYFGKNDCVSRPLFALARSMPQDKFDAGSFRFLSTVTNNENANPNRNRDGKVPAPLADLPLVEKKMNSSASTQIPIRKSSSSPLEKFENLCPPNGENKVVIYTTTLRGVRKTFEDCNAVRAAVENYGILICERDISMDRGFREELRDLMKGKEKESVNPITPPRLFIKGRYIGGAEEVMRIVEEGWMGELLKGLPKRRAGEVCDGCGDVKFLPCLRCSGSCKMVVVINDEEVRRTMVVKCNECNENGLVLCPICS